MKNLLVLLTALLALSIGAMAFAQGPGYGGGPGGDRGTRGGCGGPGYGYGGGPGGGFMWGLTETDEGKAFLKETKKLRKQLHDLQFKLKEAFLADDDKAADALKDKIKKLRDKLRKIADEKGIERGPRGDRRDDRRGGKGFRGGSGGGQGYGGCGGPYCDGPGGYGNSTDDKK